MKIAQFLSEIWQKKKRNHGNAFSMLMNEAFEKKKKSFSQTFKHIVLCSFVLNFNERTKVKRNERGWKIEKQ